MCGPATDMRGDVDEDGEGHDEFLDGDMVPKSCEMNGVCDEVGDGDGGELGDELILG